MANNSSTYRMVALLWGCILASCGGADTQQLSDYDAIPPSSGTYKPTIDDDDITLEVDPLLTSTEMRLGISMVYYCPEGTKVLYKGKDVLCGTVAPLVGAETEVSMVGGGLHSCVTDGEGICTILLDGPLRPHLFNHPRSSFSLQSGAFTATGSFADSGDRSFDLARKEHLNKKEQQFNALIESQRENRVETFLKVVEETRLVCNKHKPSLGELRKSMVHMEESARTLRSRKAGDDVAKDAFRDVWNKCLGHSKRLMKEGNRLVKKHRYKEAAPYFRFIKEVDPKLADEADSKLAGCEGVIRTYRPERIKDAAAYAEGDGVLSYFSLVNSDGDYTMSDGQVTLILATTNNDRPTQKCFKKTWEVSEDDFEMIVIGQGMLSRKALAFTLPFIKWSKMTCSMVESYYRLDGLAGLKSWDWKYGMMAEIEFRTSDGEVLRGLDTFRP